MRLRPCLRRSLPALVLFVAAHLSSAFARDLNAILTFEEFRDLVTHSTAKIPELQEIWKWRKQKNVKSVYFGGGRFRALLLWHYQQLQSHSPEEVRKMRVPPLNRLYIGNDVPDQDIYVPNNLKQAVHEWIPQWDTLGEDFYRWSVAQGGPTLDKIRVNPDGVEDPFDALRDLFDGKLAFKIHKTKDFIEGTDRYTNLALRFLRFAQDFKSMASPTPESLELIRSIPELEKTTLPYNTFACVEFPRTWVGLQGKEMSMYRVGKALRKLYFSCGESTVRTMTVLKEAGLLEFLAAKRYPIPDFNWVNLPQFVPKFMEAGFSIQEMMWVGGMLIWERSPGIAYRKALLKYVNTSEDFLRLFGFEISPSNAYRGEVGRLAASREALDRFLSMNPTLDQVKQFVTTSIYYVEDHMRFLERVIPLATTPQEFFKLAAFTREPPSTAYQNAMGRFILGKQGAFTKFNPTFEELEQLESLLLRNSRDAAAFRRGYLARFTHADAFISFVAGRRHARAQVALDHLDYFLSLKPAAGQIQSLADIFAGDTKTQLAISWKLARFAKTPEEYVQIMRGALARCKWIASSDRERAAQTFVVETFSDYLATKPSDQQILDLIGDYALDSKARAELMRKAAPVASSKLWKLAPATYWSARALKQKCAAFLMRKPQVGEGTD